MVGEREMTLSKFSQWAAWAWVVTILAAYLAQFRDLLSSLLRIAS